MEPTAKATALREARKRDGAKIRALRKELNLTQDELGDLVGQSRVEIVHIESGRRGLVHHEVRLRFVAGIGLEVPIFDGYLAGEVSLGIAATMAREALAKRGAKLVAA